MEKIQLEVPLVMLMEILSLLVKDNVVGVVVVSVPAAVPAAIV